MFSQTSGSKLPVQIKNVIYIMDTPIKQLLVGMGRSVQNLSSGQKHVYPSVMCFFFFGLIVMLFIYGVRRFLEEVEVAQAVPLLEGGYTQRTVAESFDVSKSVERHFQETGEFTT